MNAPFAAPLYVGVKTGSCAGRPALSLGGEARWVDYAVEICTASSPEHQLDRMVDAGTLDPALGGTTSARSSRRCTARCPPCRFRRASERVGRHPPGQLRDRPVGGDGRRAPFARPSPPGPTRWPHRGGAPRPVPFSTGRNGQQAASSAAATATSISRNICLWQGRPIAVRRPSEFVRGHSPPSRDVLHGPPPSFSWISTIGGRRDLSSRLLYEGRLELSLGTMPASRSLPALRVAEGDGGRALTPGDEGRRPPRRTWREGDEGPAAACPAVSSPWAGCREPAKTTVARAIAPALGAVVIRSDTARKRLRGGWRKRRAFPPPPTPAAMRGAVYRRMLVDAWGAACAQGRLRRDPRPATFLDVSLAGGGRSGGRGGLPSPSPASGSRRRLTRSPAASARPHRRRLRCGCCRWLRIQAAGDPGPLAWTARRTPARHLCPDGLGEGRRSARPPGARLNRAQHRPRATSRGAVLISRGLPWINVPVRAVVHGPATRSAMEGPHGRRDVAEPRGGRPRSCPIGMEPMMRMACRTDGRAGRHAGPHDRADQGDARRASRLPSTTDSTRTGAPPAASPAA